MEFRIIKAKIVKDKTCEVSYMRTDSDNIEVPVHEDPPREVHGDMKKAFVGLAIHFGILADYIKPKSVKKIDSWDAELIDGLKVTGFSIGGAEDELGVVLTGQKTTFSGKVVIINTPFIRFEESEETGYKFTSELVKRLDQCIGEVKEYLQGKCAEDPQQSLDFPDEEPKKKITNAKILTPEGVVGSLVDEVNGKIGKNGQPKGTPGRKKRTAQTPQNPSGIIND